MGKKLYHDALEQELRSLADQINRLKLHRDHAEGTNRFSSSRQVQRLERRQQMIAERLQYLAQEDDGIWEDIKVELRRIEDQLASGLERWSEHLDAKYAALQQGLDRQREDAPNDRRELQWTAAARTRRTS